jgi:pimeloyl-ACP methyl ester carboxylesterase
MVLRLPPALGLGGLSLLVSCAPTPAPLPPPPASAPSAQAPTETPAPADTATTTQLQLRLTVPPELGPRGTVLLLPLTADELARGEHGSARFFSELMQRVVVRREVVAADGVASVEVPVAGDRRSFVVIFDAAGLGLEALFGPRAGLALGTVSVDPNERAAEVTLTGKAFREPTEECRGEREEAITIDAPETAHPANEGVGADDGKRFVCVRLPVSYPKAKRRSYPVVFVFPGYSGLATRGNVWQRRTLFDSIGADAGEAIFVGVRTRVAEGSSYLQRSRRFGDWDHFLAEHLVAEIDRRYRTNHRRGTIGHSTGGWMAIALATRHPDVFAAAAASSPDALDFGTWLLDPEGAIQPGFLGWMRTEDAMGGPGQFVSYGAAWSEVEGGGTSRRGFAWPVDLDSGKLAPEVWARWVRASPAAELRADPTKTKRLTGKLFLTAGTADEFGLFRPTEEYVKLLHQHGIAATWLPTDLGHFGKDEERFSPLLRGLLQALR